VSRRDDRSARLGGTIAAMRFGVVSALALTAACGGKKAAGPPTKLEIMRLFKEEAGYAVQFRLADAEDHAARAAGTLQLEWVDRRAGNHGERCTGSVAITEADFDDNAGYVGPIGWGRFKQLDGTGCRWIRGWLPYAWWQPPSGPKLRAARAIVPDFAGGLDHALGIAEVDKLAASGDDWYAANRAPAPPPQPRDEQLDAVVAELVRLIGAVPEPRGDVERRPCPAGVSLWIVDYELLLALRDKKSVDDSRDVLSETFLLDLPAYAKGRAHDVASLAHVERPKPPFLWAVVRLSRFERPHLADTVGGKRRFTPGVLDGAIYGVAQDTSVACQAPIHATSSTSVTTSRIGTTGGALDKDFDANITTALIATMKALRQ
jgi:hypothetical protein